MLHKINQSIHHFVKLLIWSCNNKIPGNSILYICNLNLTKISFFWNLWETSYTLRTMLRNHFRNNTAKTLHPPNIWITDHWLELSRTHWHLLNISESPRTFKTLKILFKLLRTNKNFWVNSNLVWQFILLWV